MNFKHLEHTKDEFIKMANSQANKGIKKYGKPLNPLDSYNWRTMAKEEAIDLFMYLEAEEEKTATAIEKIRKLLKHKSEWVHYDEIMHWLDMLEGEQP